VPRPDDEASDSVVAIYVDGEISRKSGIIECFAAKDDSIMPEKEKGNAVRFVSLALSVEFLQTVIIKTRFRRARARLRTHTHIHTCENF